MRWLRKLLYRPSGKDAPAAPLPRPARPICIIGDIHGRLDLLDALLAQIDRRADPACIVVVGDMIDRCPDSAAVLARLYQRQRATPDDMICLMGNHERMLLDFVQDPARHGPRWIAAGGAETLVSYGLSPWARRQGPQAMDRLAGDLCAALPPDMLDWLTTLPLIWQSGTLTVTHAGADPALPMDAQPAHRLLWGPRKGEKPVRNDAIWVAHGHTIVAKPEVTGQRIAVDTGAWRSGRLSAAWLDADGLSFIETLSKN